MSCQSTCCLFYRHGNLVFHVHLGSMAWTGECMLTNVCLTIGKIKRNVSFYPYYSFTSHSASCDLWECIAGFLLWCFFSVSGCQVLLTTLEAPSVYTIPRSPWNYRILWACFCLGVRWHLESGWQPVATWARVWQNSDCVLFLCKSFSGFLSQTEAKTNIYGAR